MPPRKKLTAAARRAQLIEVGRSAFAQKGFEQVDVVVHQSAAAHRGGIAPLPQGAPSE